MLHVIAVTSSFKAGTVYGSCKVHKANGKLIAWTPETTATARGIGKLSKGAITRVSSAHGAAYLALLATMEMCVKNEPLKDTILDAEFLVTPLVAAQVNGEAKCKSAELLPLYARVVKALELNPGWHVVTVSKEPLF